MSAAEQHTPSPGSRRPRTGQVLCALSGKGGVGKTSAICNLAVAAGRRGARVLLVDGDLGLANIDVLLGLAPERNVEDVLAGRCALEEALSPGPAGISLLPAASGRRELAGLGEPALGALLELLRDASADFDLVAIDAGAGVGSVAIELGAFADTALLVTTAEPTALVDAYATLKLLWQRRQALRVDLLVNGVRNAAAAHTVSTQLERLSGRFLENRARFVGWIPHDRRVGDAVVRQRAVVELFPTAAVSRRLEALVQRYLPEDVGP